MKQSAEGALGRDRFYPWMWIAIVVVVAVTPLIFSPSGHDVYRAPKTIFFQAAMILLGAVFTVRQLFSESAPPRLASFRVPISIAAAAVAWTAISAMTAVRPLVAQRAPLTVFCYALLFVLTLLFARKNTFVALSALFIPAAINSVIMALQALHIWAPIPLAERPPGPARITHIGLLGNPDPAGAYLLVPAIAAVAAFLVFPGRWQRQVSAIATVLLLAGLLLTESITVMAAVAAVFVAFAVVVRVRAVRWVVVGLFATGALVLLTYLPTRDRLGKMLDDVMHRRYSEATSYRLPAYSVAWRMFLDHPLTGIGPGGYSAAYMSYKVAGDADHPEWISLANFNFGEAHNDHLQVLAETGLPGYALMVAALVYVAHFSFKRSAGGGEHQQFVRVFAFPAATGFAVLALAQFPLYLTACVSALTYAAALCAVWGGDAPS